MDVGRRRLQAALLPPDGVGDLLGHQSDGAQLREVSQDLFEDEKMVEFGIDDMMYF